MYCMIDIKEPFDGVHCETTALGALIRYLGCDYSEAMLFGIGEGLGYGIITWGYKGFPFIGGRVKTGELTKNFCRNLNFKLNRNRTTSVNKAWNTVKESIDNGIPTMLQLDSYHLEYFTSKVHFAGHYVTMIGYDDNNAFLIDTTQQGGRVKTSLKSLALARNEKGPMSDKNLSITIQKGEQVTPLKQAILTAIRNNAKDYLNPIISNFGYKGIARTAKEIDKWFDKSEDVEKDFIFTATMMERAGTGGALFRKLYSDFLKEAYDIVGSHEILKAYELFRSATDKWHEIANIFIDIGKSKDRSYLQVMKDILFEIEKIEVEAMEILLNV